MKRFVFRNRWLPYALVAPQVVITIAFFYWPAFDSLRLSLYRASPFGDRLIWAGLANFERLFRDPAYLRSALTSFVFSFVVTFAGLALALLLASLANAKIRGLAVYRSLLLWPYGIAPAIAGIIWLFIFHPSYGILPWLLSFVTAYQFNWFLKGWVAMTLIVMAAIWKQFGYNLAFYLAGLQAIDASVLEAASVDGAGPIRRFFAVTVPLLSLAPPADLAVHAASRVTARDGGGIVAHAILLAAVAVLAFPLYYAFVISTQTLSHVASLPPRPWLSTAFLSNYAEAWQRAQMG